MFYFQLPVEVLTGEDADVMIMEDYFLIGNLQYFCGRIDFDRDLSISEELLKQIAPAIKIYSLEPEEIIKNNQKIIKSAELHKNREYFFKNIDNVEIEKNIKKNIILPKNKKIKNIVKEMAYKTKTYNMIRKIIK